MEEDSGCFQVDRKKGKKTGTQKKIIRPLIIDYTHSVGHDMALLLWTENFYF